MAFNPTSAGYPLPQGGQVLHVEAEPRAVEVEAIPQFGIYSRGQISLQMSRGFWFGESVDVQVQWSRATFVTSFAPTSTIEVAREAILSLLDARDFLGYQLAHAKGAIGKREFNRIADAYFARPHHVNDEKLLESKVSALVQLIGTKSDSETIATIFNCELEQAEAALRGVASKIAKQGSSQPMLSR